MINKYTEQPFFSTDIGAVPYVLTMLATLAAILVAPQPLYHWRRPGWAAIDTE